MESLRDWAVIYAGILWMFGTLVITVIAGAVWWGTRYGFGFLNGRAIELLRQVLAQAHGRLAAIQDQSSRLPGNTPTIEVEARDKGSSLRLPSLPFRRKKRRILPLPR